MAYIDQDMRGFYLEYLLLAMGFEPANQLIQSLGWYFSDQNTNDPVDIATLVEDQLTYNLLSFPNGVRNDDKMKRSMVYPNEGHPENARLELERLKAKGIHIRKGAYVAVGSERGLLSAPIFEATDIILVDNNRLVVAYNLINAALLQVSTSLADYIYLRFYANLEIWKKRLLGAIKDVSLDDYDLWFAMWREKVQQLSPIGYDTLTGYGLERLHLNDPDYFRGVNYLYDETLWQFLHDMAASGRIHVYECDLKDFASIGQFFGYLKTHDIQVGVFDLSNGWWQEYGIPLNAIFWCGHYSGVLSSDPESCTAFLFTHRCRTDDPNRVLDSWTYWLMPYDYKERISSKLFCFGK